MRKNTSLHLFLYGIHLYVFFQLLTWLIEATYTFGLLNTDIPPEVGFVFFLLSPFFLLVYPKLLDGQSGRRLALACGALALACWGAAQYLDMRGQMIASGIGVGAILLCLPALFRQRSAPQPGFSLAAGLAFSMIMLIMIRVQNYGSGPLPGEQRVINTAGIIALGLLELVQWSRRSALPATDTSPTVHSSFGRTALAYFGLASTLVLLYFSFTSPVVIARWGGISYPLALSLTGASIGFFLIALTAYQRSPVSLPSRLITAWNGLFIVSLCGALLSLQVRFPAEPGSYPLAQPAASPLVMIALYLAIVLHLILYIDFALFTSQVKDHLASARVLAGSSALAAFFMLVLLFAHIFTTVYDYIPVIGPAFRDRFWLVYAVPGVMILLAAALVREKLEFKPNPVTLRWPLMLAAVLTILVFMSAFSVHRIAIASPGSGGLTFMTYNIQQGYRPDAQNGYKDQLELIQAYEPDILGLQESDTARIANGNRDVVGYMAGNLQMHQYYGPKTVTGTFGIALLSRYPIENPQTYFMFSEGEQTAAITAEIKVGGTRYTVLVTHLGNGGPLVQQTQVLDIVRGKQNVVLMGDFNFRPDSEQYAQTTALFNDGWLTARVQDNQMTGENIDRRIDHFFVSPAVQIERIVYLAKGPSDHPAVYLQLAPGE